jgi:hypothetical protein
VIQGGTWVDSRSGEYANPSYFYDVVDRAISDSGVVFEETVPRDPPIGYSFYHMWAMLLVAQIAEVHFDAPDLWDYEAPGGGSLRKAFDNYAGYILGTKTSPAPGGESGLGDSYGWLYESAVSHWNDPKHIEVLEQLPRTGWIFQSIGPVALLLGPDL